MDPYYRPTRAEISLDALHHNLQAFRSALPAEMRIMAVVKGNAYGHGALAIADEAVRGGADYLGVAFLDEALELRRAGIAAPILVLGYTPPDGFDQALRHDITLTVFSDDALYGLARLPRTARRLKVHVKIDTGMSRIGLPGYEEAVRFIDKLLELESVEVEGLFTHYARADEADKRYTLDQYERLVRIVEHYRSRGIGFPYVHAGNSAAAIDTPQYCFNMVRLGISMYGLYPSQEVNRQRVELEPVMRLVTRVVMLKDIPAGTPVSYGGIYTAQGKETIATIPVGYADGYSRMLTGKACVLVKGRRVPVVGRICMDQCMINVTGIDAALGDEVVLIGSQGDERITAEELADWLGTINYEVTSMVSNRVPRVYLRGGQCIRVVNPLLH